MKFLQGSFIHVSGVETKIEYNKNFEIPTL